MVSRVGAVGRPSPNKNAYPIRKENRVKNDEVLMSLLEQADILTEAWTESLPTLQAIRGESCPSSETLQKYAAGAFESEQAVAVASHLGDCQHCRGEARQWRILRDAELGVGTCVLSTLREIMHKEPGLSAQALVRVSQRIAHMVSPLPSEQALPKRIDLGILGPQGEPLGEWLSIVIERVPYIDSQYRLCLEVRALPPGYEGSRLRLLLKNEHGKINVGAVTLTEGMTKVAVDLSDLYIKPGYLPIETIEVVVERVRKETEHFSAALVETGPQMKPVVAEIDRAVTVSQTMTSEQLVGVLAAKRKPVTVAPATEKPAAKEPSARRETTGQEEEK